MPGIDIQLQSGVPASSPHASKHEKGGDDGIATLANLVVDHLTVSAGKVLKADTLQEITVGAGVTVDGVLVKDSLIAWAYMNKAGSSLADLATKSAGALDSGQLAIARMPTGGAWALSSDLNIDSNTLVVDISTDRVGIGTTGPQGLLHVDGRVFVTGDAPVASSGAGVITYYSGTYGGIFAHDYDEVAPKNLVLQIGGGNVGIGDVAAPDERLDVLGAIALHGLPSVNYYKILPATDQTYLGIGYWVDSNWYPAAGTPAVTLTYLGNVGIGVIDPDAKTDINGQIKIRGGNPVAGRVLTCNAVGLATWEVPGAGGGMEVHVLATTAGLGAYHSTSGLTAGQVLRASSATAAAFAQLAFSDLNPAGTCVAAGLTLGSTSISEANLTTIKTHVGL